MKYTLIDNSQVECQEEVDTGTQIAIICTYKQYQYSNVTTNPDGSTTTTNYQFNLETGQYDVISTETIPAP